LLESWLLRVILRLLRRDGINEVNIHLRCLFGGRMTYLETLQVLDGLGKPWVMIIVDLH
jgi:hypothetical protein